MGGQYDLLCPVAVISDCPVSGMSSRLWLSTRSGRQYRHIEDAVAARRSRGYGTVGVPGDRRLGARRTNRLVRDARRSVRLGGADDNLGWALRPALASRSSFGGRHIERVGIAWASGQGVRAVTNALFDTRLVTRVEYPGRVRQSVRAHAGAISHERPSVFRRPERDGRRTTMLPEHGCRLPNVRSVVTPSS